MPERPRDSRVIHEVQQFLGLTPGLEPLWAFQLVDERVFPEEAPTRHQREQAEACLAHLAFVIRHDTALFTTQVLQAVYTDHHLRAARAQTDDHLTDFTLAHLLGAVRTYGAWAQEVKLFEETDFYDTDIRMYGALRAVLEQLLADE